MRRIALAAGMIALTATALAAPEPTTAAPTAASQVGPDTEPTAFALHAVGFGTRVIGGEVPVDSGTTAWMAIGCTNKAGIDKTNYEAQVTLPELGTISGVRTRVWTTKVGDTVNVFARHRIAEVVIAQEGEFKLTIEGVSSRSHVWHDADGFHHETSSNVLAIRIKNGDDPVSELPIPTPGDPVEVPGLVRITAGKSVKIMEPGYVRAAAVGLQVDVLATDTTVKLAQSAANMSRGVKTGVFSGWAASLRASVLDPIVKVGRTPYRTMPCQGTDGELQTKSVVGSEIPGLIDAGVLEIRQRSQQTHEKAWGFEVAEVADVSLFDGRVIIKAVKGRANVTRLSNGDLTRNAKGTQIGELIIDGEPQALPLEDTIEIPGLLTIEPKVIKRLKSGIQVIALQLILLDGSGAKVDLGVARLQIARSGL